MVPSADRLKLHLLTPLWTAGASSGRMDRVHETGIIGSLRWWYEATLRALGRDVCDPTSDDPRERCPRDNQHYCDVCQLFGATGHRRCFRLEMEDGDPLFRELRIPLPSGRLHPKRRNPVGAWYLQGESRTGDLTLGIVPLGPVDAADKLRIPLTLIHRHAALGAKVSSGYGVVRITEENGDLLAVDSSLVERLAGSGRMGQPSGDLPDLRDFFFAKLRFQAPSEDPNWWQKIQGIAETFNGQVTDQGETRRVFKNPQEHNEATNTLVIVVQQQGVVPLAPAVRNWLRYTWFPSRFQPGTALGSLEGYLFGQTRPNHNIASKINVSHAYRLDSGEWEFRIWGWIPCTTPAGLSLNRDSFLQDLKGLLSGPKTDWTPVFGPGSALRPGIPEWHPLDRNNRDGATYLNELLGLTAGAGAS
ncbi:MAG: type III-B CRISPR module RAMP protein Cmr1 [Chloroflexi bacterium]|nr:type III-B CRISPR module RAMP protein Cmr1 [Chloroflexota bacterium]